MPPPQGKPGPPSRWVTQKLAQALEEWPEGYFQVLGSLADSDLERPAQPKRSRTAEGGLEEIAGKFRPRQLKDLKPHDRGFVESILESRRSRPRR